MRKHFLLYINNSTTNKMSKMFLIVVHIVIHNGGNNGDIPRGLKCYIQNFKTSLKKLKILLIKDKTKSHYEKTEPFTAKYLSH